LATTPPTSQIDSGGGRPASLGRRLAIGFAVFLLWTATAIFFATQLYFAGLTWQNALAWTLPRWYAWGLVAPCVFWLDRRLAATTTLPVRLALHVPLAVIFTSATILLRLTSRFLRGALPDDLGTFYLERLYSDLPIYAVLAGISFSRRYAEQVRRSAEQAHALALRTTELERRLVESQLQSLRAQLQPHFLFNALNTISAFTESNPQMARRLMAQLGDLLRASLRHTAQPLVTLGEELTFLDDFLAIESARFEGRLHVSVQAEDEVLAVRVPSFLLQPLAENAIRHGVGPRLSGGRVDITATGTAATLSVRVRDDGVGLPPEWNFERDAGVGLRNVAARLEHIYGRPGLLRVVPQAAGGVEVQIDVPREPPGVTRPEPQE
jgi:two-component system LytT family sensor kinase